ncbi:MAG TPA: hypothetical protein VG248_03370 [Caulobacteraceae bacterium]|nr:hypothetical protein [Caulobacteraceae bacterium]
MTIPLDTLLLDRTSWDLVVDASGNIAMAAPPYAVAQDVASAIKARKGEVWYDTTKGVPYDQIWGKLPPLQAVKAAFVKAAFTVPGVVTAKCFLSGLAGRKLVGQVQVTDNTGAAQTVAF